MARRRSARLAQGATPKSSSVVPQLGSVEEQSPPPTTSTSIDALIKTTAESAQEPSPEPTTTLTRSASAKKLPKLPAVRHMPATPRQDELAAYDPLPSTPLNSSAIKPPRSEMHPSKVPHPTQAGLHLGFADLKPATLEASRTPSKLGPISSPPPVLAPNVFDALQSSPFMFRHTSRLQGLGIERDGDDGDARGPVESGLSSDAAKMMAELSGPAAKIRDELVAAKRAQEAEEQTTVGAAQSERKIAKPRGRFSAAHQALFDKMKSIENHPSSWRLNRSPVRQDAGDVGSRQSPSKAADTLVTGLRSSPSKSATQKDAPATATKSLKRTQSKANFHDDDGTSSASAAVAPATTAPSLRTPSKPVTTTGASTTTTMTTSSLRRTQSKASLTDKPTGIPTASAQRSLKRTLSKANLGDSKDTSSATKATPTSATSKSTTVSLTKSQSPTKSQSTVLSRIPAPCPMTPSVKRIKTRFEDDASSNRPAETDTNANAVATPTTNTAIPRPRAAAGALTPGRSTMARLKSATTMMRTGSMTPGQLRRPAETVTAGSQTEKVYKVAPASRFSQMRATIQARLAEARGGFQSSSGVATTAATSDNDAQTAGAQMTNVQTSAPPPAVHMPSVQTSPTKTKTPTNPEPTLPTFPAVPTTSPSRAHFKRVQFTPKTAEIVFSQDSPTPIKMTSRLPGRTPGGRTKTIEVSYPDLSRHEEILQATPKEDTVSKVEVGPETQDIWAKTTQATPSMNSAVKSLAKATPPPSIVTRARATPRGASSAVSVPGTFTFRSDHTIKFESPSTAFGAIKGQSSIRQVRPSILPAISIPGAFPSGTDHPVLSDKENESEPATPSPVKVTAPENAIPHGLQNKKRARVTWEEEDKQLAEEEKERAKKKMRKEHPAAAVDLFGGGASDVGKPGGSTTTGSSARGDPASSPIRKQPPKTPSNQPATAVKKKPFLSVSRLNMLAQPKRR